MFERDFVVLFSVYVNTVRPEVGWLLL